LLIIALLLLLLNTASEQELAIAELFEPQIAKAARNIFGASYSYKRRYVAFKSKKP
jgi:hypothetical protein